MTTFAGLGQETPSCLGFIDGVFGFIRGIFGSNSTYETKLI